MILANLRKKLKEQRRRDQEVFLKEMRILQLKKKYKTENLDLKKEIDTIADNIYYSMYKERIKNNKKLRRIKKFSFKKVKNIL